jgi:hypothetical protein
MTRLRSTMNSDLNIAKPLTITIDDHSQARADHPATLHMRWSVDEDTTRRLCALRLIDKPVPLWRRVIRLLTTLFNRVGG